MGRLLPPRTRGCFRTYEEYEVEFQRWLRVARRQRAMQLGTYFFSLVGFFILFVLIAVKELMS